MNAHLIKLLTLFIAALGVGLFAALNLPLPWLLGPMFGCLVASLVGVPLQGVPVATSTMRTVLGVAVGASITPALFGRLGDMAVTIALIPVFVGVIGVIGYPYFRKICKFDAATSYYAAMPGGLQDMLIFGEEAGGNPRILSLVHATRVLVIVTALPILMAYATGVDLNRPPGAPVRDLPLQEGILMLFLAIAGWRVAVAIGLFGASILGPMIFAAVASMLGFLHQRPPAEIILAAQFFIGIGVGAKYVGVTLSELRHVVAAALGYTVLLAIVSATFTAAVVLLGLAPFTEALLAFSPGGQAEMAVLAIVAGADIAFVVSHHVIRILTVIIGAPIVRRFLS